MSPPRQGSPFKKHPGFAKHARFFGQQWQFISLDSIAIQRGFICHSCRTFVTATHALRTYVRDKTYTREVFYDPDCGREILEAYAQFSNQLIATLPSSCVKSKPFDKMNPWELAEVYRKTHSKSVLGHLSVAVKKKWPPDNDRLFPTLQRADQEKLLPLVPMAVAVFLESLDPEAFDPDIYEQAFKKVLIALGKRGRATTITIKPPPLKFLKEMGPLTILRALSSLPEGSYSQNQSEVNQLLFPLILNQKYEAQARRVAARMDLPVPKDI